MPSHFLPRRHPWCRDVSMWSMVRLGGGVWSQMYCILETYHRLFRKVAVRDPRHNSDHYLVLGCLRRDPLREHTEYLGRRTQIPLQPPTSPTR